MGWFDEQIKQRKQSDDQLLEEAFVRMADAVLGTKMASAYQNDEDKAAGEIGEILRYYRIRPREVPDAVKGLEDRLEYLLRPNGIMRRNVKLEKGWYRDAIGAILGRRRDDGTVVALIPRGLAGYAYYDAGAARWVRITKKNEGLFDDEAICFYKPFPLTKLTVPMLMRYVAQCVDRADVVLVVLSMLLVSLVGLMMPWLTALLFGSVAASGSLRLLLALYPECINGGTTHDWYYWSNGTGGF